MRSFSNITLKFANKLHLLVDSLANNFYCLAKDNLEFFYCEGVKTDIFMYFCTQISAY